MPCVRGIKVRRLESFEIEDLADRYHNRYARCSVDAAVDMERLLEFIDGKPIDLPDHAGGKGKIVFATAPKLAPNVLGRTRFDAENKSVIIEVSDDTYAQVRKGNWFARATVAHELFHVKTHVRDLVRISEMTNEQFSFARDVSSHVNRRDSEWQAERFASAFIAPAEGLRHLNRRNVLTPYEVARIYKMSLLSAQYRVRDFLAAELERGERTGTHRRR